MLKAGEHTFSKNMSQIGEMLKKMHKFEKLQL